MMQRQKIQMKKARKEPGRVRASDVQNLVAARSSPKTLTTMQILVERMTRDTTIPSPDPDNSPIDNPRRAMQFLDSLAALLVSKSHGEVIATALRIDGNSKTIEVMVTGNSEVPAATVAHLRWIWETLQKISKQFYTSNPPPEGRKTKQRSHQGRPVPGITRDPWTPVRQLQFQQTAKGREQLYL
jgi:hypothetical protein